MLPSNLNLNIENKKGCNSKILVSNTDMKIGSNRDINRDHKKLPKKIVAHAAQHDPVETTIPRSLKMLPSRTTMKN